MKLSISDDRSPLKAPPLRNPGQSLDEEIQRLIDDEANSYLFVAMCLLFFTLMEWLRWWLRFPPQPILFTVVTVAATAYVVRKMTAKPRSQTVWVLNPTALPSFLEHQPTRLTESDAQLATYHLSRFARAAPPSGRHRIG
jgi:hypothetical protein